MNDPRLSKEQRRERVRQRVKLQFDEDKYEYYPGVEPPDYYNNDVRQLVAIYVRVSTDDPRQTTSFEIQRQYYEEFVTRHPNWVLVDIYADEGISGTSLKHRDQFNRMIDDCRAGKITLIICKSVSRFARNVVDFLEMVRMLSEHNPPIGVFFEAENIFSLNETAQMALSFQATMAEEESRNKSRSMETSLRMRLDHGLLLTPKLLGFMHDDEGHLIPDPRTRHLPKLIFYMYLYGYTTAQIAEALTFVGQRTYRGNIRWQPAVISYVLHNERYCGDVFTRKTYTQDVLTHRKLKNRGQRPRSRYLDTHEAIISRDDFIAVQHRLNNARFGSKSILPELMVIPQGLLRGFVIINPRWGAFQAQDYRDASMSAYMDGEDNADEVSIEFKAGDFDLRGFEIAHLDMTIVSSTPFVSFFDKKIKFGQECLNRMQTDGYVELLVHPSKQQFAVRRTTKDNRNAVVWASTTSKRNQTRTIAATAFSDTLYSLFGWDRANKYRIFGTMFMNDSEQVYIFNARDAGVFLKANSFSGMMAASAMSAMTPALKLGKRVIGVPEERARTFGRDFYRQQSLTDVDSQTREQWQLRIEGQLYSTGQRLNVTDYDELKEYIRSQIGDWKPQEVEQDDE